MSLGLIHVSDQQTGYCRRKHGRGYVYLDKAGKKITGKNLLKRIKSLKIPPAWEVVWICKDENGYLQATGYDEKRRKQYIYHPQWDELSQHEKYSRLIEFANSLPKIRYQIQKALSEKQWSHSKMLALLVNVMDEEYMRIGNTQYEAENDTFGATTIRRRHLVEDDEGIALTYRAKSGKMRTINIRAPKLASLVKESSELPGYEIFSYPGPDGISKIVSSQDVNEYVKEISGHDFTSKSFRTWGGTVLALKEWKAAKEIISDNNRKKLKPTLVKRVAEKLGNTAPVAEKYYIHPVVLQKITRPDFHPANINVEPMEDLKNEFLDASEKKVLAILKEQQG